MRETCPNKDVCGPTGHIVRNGKAERCACLQLEMMRRKLGPMFTEAVVSSSNLAKVATQNLVIDGPLTAIRPHVARVLLDMAEKAKTWVTLDAYRLIEIFLSQDQEYESATPAIESDLFILLLGFGDPPNRYLPELVVQALSRRELMDRPSWVILGIAKERIAGKYSSALAEYLNRYQQVAVK